MPFFTGTSEMSRQASLSTCLRALIQPLCIRSDHDCAKEHELQRHCGRENEHSMQPLNRRSGVCFLERITASPYYWARNRTEHFGETTVSCFSPMTWRVAFDRLTFSSAVVFFSFLFSFFFFFVLFLGKEEKKKKKTVCDGFQRRS